MVTAIVLMNVERSRVNRTAEELAGMQEVSEVYSVSGRFDLVAMIRVKTNDQVAEMVTNRLPEVEGIQSTETMLAFRAYSRHDLDRMFSLGFEQ